MSVRDLVEIDLVAGDRLRHLVERALEPSVTLLVRRRFDESILARRICPLGAGDLERIGVVAEVVAVDRLDELPRLLPGGRVRRPCND